MMEVESSHAHYQQIVNAEQIQATLNWHQALNMDANNNFGSNGPANGYTQRRGDEEDFRDGYMNGNGNLEYGWTNEAGFVSNNVGQSIGLPSQNGGYIVDNKELLQPTIVPLAPEESIAPADNGIGGDVGAVQNAAYPHMDDGLLLDQALWEQPIQQLPQDFLMPNNNSHMTAAVPDPLLAFAPDIQVSAADLSYGIMAPSGFNGLGISHMPLGSDMIVSQDNFSDETPQRHYTSLTASPSFAVGYEETQNLGHYSPNPSALVMDENEQNVGQSVEEIENFLFSGNDATVSSQVNQHQHQLPQQPLPGGLEVPIEDFQLAVVPRESPVPGYYHSPRTPSGWGSISPSPNGQIFIVADPVLDDFNGIVPFGYSPGQTYPQPNFNNLVGSFDANATPESKKRKRKAYNAEGKKKVNQVRELGACVSCHARKIPCEIEGVCGSCFKTTGDRALAQHICVRTKLRDVYKSVKDIHDSLEIRQERLEPILASLTGEPKAVDLTVANARLGYKFRLRLQVMQCASSPKCRWKRLDKVNGIYVTRDEIQDQRYVIVPKTLPSIQDYDNFGRQILATSNGSHSGSLTQLLDEFLLGYCRNSPQSRLREFADSTLRVASLSRLVAYGFLNLYDGSYDLLDRHTGIPITENRATRRYVSETVHDQLRILAAKGLEPTEKYVFQEIDNLNKLFGKVKNGRIVSGICVLRLMLLYRDRVIRDSIRLGLPRGSSRHQNRLEKAAFMYKRLTIAYGTLCRESTPLILTWELDNERNPTDEDVEMTRLFAALQPAFEDFCNDKLTPDHDEVFKGLIINAPRVERRPSKKRKGQANGAARVTEYHGHVH